MIQALATQISSSAVAPLHSSTDGTTREDRLIHQAQNGNLEAFNQLVLIYQDHVFRQALWILKDEAAAEDAAQEAFLIAYRKLNTLRGGTFRPWLLRITTNYCLDQLRIAKRRPAEPLERYDDEGEEIEPYWLRDPSETPEQALERAELQEEILRSVEKLSWEFRLPIILADVQELNYEEASAVMQLPVGTFKSRLSRARQKLYQDFRRKNLTLQCGMR